VAPQRSAPGARPPAHDAAPAPAPLRLQVTAPDVCALAAIDPAGARLLLFPPDGGLALFTGERTSADAAGSVGPLEARLDAAGGVSLRYRGPMLRFPDTTPFLDLETGLATAHLVEVDVALEVVPAHTAGGDADFGRARGRVTVDGARIDIAGDAFVETGAGGGPWPRFRAALRLDDETSVSCTLGLDGGAASGFLCRAGLHVPVVAGRAALGPPDAAFDRVRLDLELEGGERLQLGAQAVHVLPVVRARGTVPVRVAFAACRLDGGAGPAWPAGWCEIAGF
jgi:hypothetical protein